jgi:hypothetical protein
MGPLRKAKVAPGCQALRRLGEVGGFEFAVLRQRDPLLSPYGSALYSIDSASVLNQCDAIGARLRCLGLRTVRLGGCACTVRAVRPTRQCRQVRASPLSSDHDATNASGKPLPARAALHAIGVQLPSNLFVVAA